MGQREPVNMLSRDSANIAKRSLPSDFDASPGDLQPKRAVNAATTRGSVDDGVAQPKSEPVRIWAKHTTSPAGRRATTITDPEKRRNDAREIDDTFSAMMATFERSEIHNNVADMMETAISIGMRKDIGSTSGGCVQDVLPAARIVHRQRGAPVGQTHAISCSYGNAPAAEAQSPWEGSPK